MQINHSFYNANFNRNQLEPLLVPNCQLKIDLKFKRHVSAFLIVGHASQVRLATISIIVQYMCVCVCVCIIIQYSTYCTVTLLTV